MNITGTLLEAKLEGQSQSFPTCEEHSISQLSFKQAGLTPRHVSSFSIVAKKVIPVVDSNIY
jgi:hypothetical protein